MEQLEIERLNYNEEYDNFCSIIDQSLAGFRSNYNILDETELNVGVVTNLESMNDAIQALMDTLHQKDKVLNNDASDRIDSLKKESQDFENKCVTKENELRILASQEDFKSTELENLRRKEAKNEKVQDMMKSKISKDMEKWKNTLGLELVVSTHNSLIFKFSNILRDNPEKTFSCEMRVIPETRKYKVENCLPQLDSLESMVETLNRTNDLSGFVVKLRKKFVETSSS